MSGHIGELSFSVCHHRLTTHQQDFDWALTQPYLLVVVMKSPLPNCVQCHLSKYFVFSLCCCFPILPTYPLHLLKILLFINLNTQWHLIANSAYIMTLSSVTRLGDLLVFGQFLKPLATNNLSKSPTFLGNFFKGVKIYHFLVK